MRRLLPAFVLASAFAGLCLQACRYSVRDTGFVDFGSVPYRLELAAGDLPDAVADLYRQSAASLLLDSNIEFGVGSPTTPGRPTLSLTDATGRRFDAIQEAPLPRQREEVTQLMESIVASPLRENIHREALQSFAVLVLVEGTEAAANERARSVLQKAIDAVERLMPGMPKPVAVPPQLIVVPISGQSSEALTLWGLGLDPAPDPDPRLAIVYGRGRRLGAPLEGPTITRTAVQERLVMIGQDCECDLDRAWLKGLVLPGRWDRELQEIAARTLGFDPENPMVRTEVSRIVLRGEGERTRQSRPTSALALGYTEEAVDSGPTDSAVAGSDTDDSPSATNGPLAATASAEPKNAVPAATAPASTAGPIWVLFLGGLAAAVGAGVWILRRGTRNQ